MKRDKEMEVEKDACAHQKTSKLDKLRSRLKLQEGKKNAKEIPEGLHLKGWQMLSNTTKRKSGNLLRILFRAHVFQLLGALSLILCAILFAIQAYLAFRSFQMMNQLHKKPQIPEILYRIYFEGNDWVMDHGRVDLRANTSIFIH